MTARLHTINLSFALIRLRIIAGWPEYGKLSRSILPKRRSS